MFAHHFLELRLVFRVHLGDGLLVLFGEVLHHPYSAVFSLGQRVFAAFLGIAQLLLKQTELRSGLVKLARNAGEVRFLLGDRGLQVVTLFAEELWLGAGHSLLSNFR